MFTTIQNPKTDWQPYLEEIRHLYSDMGLSLAKVQKHMMDHRGLKATEKQYKLLFKRLGKKKNLTAAQWHSIGLSIRTRELKGKKTQVVFGGKPLDEARVKREVARYKSRFENPKSVLSVPLSPVIALRTPSPSPLRGMNAVEDDPTSQAIATRYESPSFTNYLDNRMIGLIVEPEEHWETISLDFPSDAMSDVDLGDIATNIRKMLLYNLPSRRSLRRLFFTGSTYPFILYIKAGSDIEIESEANQRECCNGSDRSQALPKAPFHLWSWESLRSVLDNVRPLGKKWPRHYLPPRSDGLSLCTETQLLRIVVAIFVNELADISMYRPDTSNKCYGGSELWSWLLRQEHLNILSSVVNGQLGFPYEVTAMFCTVFLRGMAIWDDFWSTKPPGITDRDITKAFSVVMDSLNKGGRKLVGNDWTRLLRRAVSLGDSDIAQSAIENGADCNGGGPKESILSLALVSRRINIIGLVLEKGAKTGECPLVTAIEKETNTEVSYLQMEETTQSRTLCDMDMNIEDDVYISQRSLFTYIEFCIFRSPSLGELLNSYNGASRRNSLTAAILAGAAGQKPPVNTPNIWQELALLGAAEFRNFELARRLLLSGVDPECSAVREYVRKHFRAEMGYNHEPYTPLQHAFRNMDDPMFELLLDAGACIEEDILNCLSPVEDPDLMSFIRRIAPRLDRTIISPCGVCLLFLAVHDEDRDTIDDLITIGVDINTCITSRHCFVDGVLQEAPFTPLICALRHCDRDIVEYLWNKGAQFMDKAPSAGSYELCVVCDEQHHDMSDTLDFILAKGAWPNQPCWILTNDHYHYNRFHERPKTPLQWLLHHDTLEEISSEMLMRVMQATKVLLRYGADIDCGLSTEMTPLQQACKMESYAIAKLLLEEGSDANSQRRGTSPLAHAVRIGCFALAKLLVEHGAVTTGKPLEAACFGGDLQMIQFLVDNGADVNFVATSGRTALTAACNSGQLQVVELLMEMGADPNPPCGYCTPQEGGRGFTPLQCAIAVGVIEIILLLLEAGAAVDALSAFESKLLRRQITAIEFAVMHGKYDITKILINAGAEKNVTEGKFAGAIRIAEEYGFVHIVELLREHASL